LTEPTEAHPAAAIFPLLKGKGFDDLVEDIRANGLRHAIVRHPDGSILDGRNRERACIAAGIRPDYIIWSGKPGTEGAYVLSVNVRRRHLSASQRAMLAAEIANLPSGVRPDRSANLRTVPVTQSQAAAIANVSERSVQLAKAVLDSGSPDLIDRVKRGEITVSKAATKEKAAKQVKPAKSVPPASGGQMTIDEAIAAAQPEKPEDEEPASGHATDDFRHAISRIFQECVAAMKFEISDLKPDDAESIDYMISASIQRLETLRKKLNPGGEFEPANVNETSPAAAAG
jgi:hypothetical protein